ncbi:uncharacterized protein BJ171DRAFT_579766 [Polychytrium aggregatum]|uniref:uncharacterized protein n=1 Tax=Polychytrium aggregatum TaxID=110093 RepID=UPI0022FE79CC|nr:uncharacterized protein BJ171DRAFT_579766 [Polychytrium aggregatum]KAI9206256.1 hypothetical protein BJ171DRAFT_579766 [Polychytrium aggregatum]
MVASDIKNSDDLIRAFGQLSLDEQASALTALRIRMSAAAPSAIAPAPAPAFSVRPKIPLPEPFTGVRKAGVVEEFILSMNEYIDYYQLDDDVAVRNITMNLRGTAKSWWRLYAQRYPGEAANMTPEIL